MTAAFTPRRGAVVSSSLWQPGPPGVTVTTLPWTLAADRFTLVMGVYRGEEEGWEAGDRLQLTTVASDSVAAENGTLLRIGAFERSLTGGWQPVPPATLDTGPLRSLDAEVAGSFRLAAAAVPETIRSGAPLPVQLRWVKPEGARRRVAIMYVSCSFLTAAAPKWRR